MSQYSAGMIPQEVFNHLLEENHKLEKILKATLDIEVYFLVSMQGEAVESGTHKHDLGVRKA